MENVNFTRDELNRLRMSLTAGKLKASPGVSGLSECAQGVVSMAASELINIIFKRMNEKGKFGFLAWFGVAGDLIAAANRIIAGFRACKESNG